MIKKKKPRATFESMMSRVWCDSGPRDTILHCHISKPSKEWLIKVSDRSGRSIGQLVEEIVSLAKEGERHA